LNTYSKLGSLELNSAKNLAHLNGLKAIQFAFVFYDQGAIYLYKKSMVEIYLQRILTVPGNISSN
jgi:hypothetical protein